MKLSAPIVCLLLKCVIWLAEGAKSSPSVKDCLTSLKEYSSSGANFYQAIIFVENTEAVGRGIVDQLFLAFNNLAHVNLANANDVHVEHASILFIFITVDSIRLRAIFDRLLGRKWPRHLPKFLLIFRGSKIDLELLRYAWSRNFADVTILQLVESGTLDSVRKSSTWRVIVHNYDPFEDVINSSRNCDSHTLWHPNKLDDLRGHPLNVDLSDDPPFSYVTRNATGHVLATDGSAAKILDFIAQGINFTPYIVPRLVKMNNDIWTEASYEDYFSELRKGRAEFVANDRAHPINGLEQGEFDYSHQVGFDKHCLVVPVLESPRYDVLRHLLHPFLGVLVLAMFKIGTAYMPNFDQRNWKWLVTLQIFLGISVHKNPHNSSERIFMMCIIIFSIYNLGYIFSEIQNIKLGSRQQIDIDELSDLVKLNISIQANYDELSPDERSINYNITSKISVQNWISRNHCINMLLKHKNVSCLMSRLFAKMRVLHHVKKLNSIPMKMMRNCITSLTTRFPFQNDSPYLTGVNKLIRLLQSSGIRNNLIKIDVMTVKIMEKSGKEPVIDPNVQLNIHVPIYIGLGGLTFAAMVFTFEIILGLKQKKIICL